MEWIFMEWFKSIGEVFMRNLERNSGFIKIRSNGNKISNMIFFSLSLFLRTVVVCKFIRLLSSTLCKHLEFYLEFQKLNLINQINCSEFQIQILTWKGAKKKWQKKRGWRWIEDGVEIESIILGSRQNTFRRKYSKKSYRQLD